MNDALNVNMKAMVRLSALLEQFTSGRPVGQNRVGLSSEWSCDSLRPPATQHEVKSWTRSKVSSLHRCTFFLEESSPILGRF